MIVLIYCQCLVNKSVPFVVFNVILMFYNNLANSFQKTHMHCEYSIWISIFQSVLLLFSASTMIPNFSYFSIQRSIEFRLPDSSASRFTHDFLEPHQIISTEVVQFCGKMFQTVYKISEHTELCILLSPSCHCPKGSLVKGGGRRFTGEAMHPGD